MIRKWFILGIMGVVVILLLIDMYREVIVYNPLEGIGAAVKESPDGIQKISSSSESGWGKEIIDNNLFSPSRTPTIPIPQKLQAQMKQAEMVKRPELFLKGIILDQYGDFVAYIEKDKAKAVSVRKGDRLDDVDVVDIKQKSVELKWNDETISLSLDKIKTIKKPR